MFSRNIGKLLLAIFVIGGLMCLALPGSAGENAAGVKSKTRSPKKAHLKKAGTKIPGKLAITDGTKHPEAARGTQWVIYDDNSREAWGASWTPNSGARGNKFTSTWGSFYVDMMSAYVKWTTTGSSLYFSMWTATTNTGSDLQGNAYTDPFTGLASSGSGWLLADGSTSSLGFIGNSGSAFSNTAWLGVWVYSGNDVGIDTNGGGSHGFYVDSYTGSGYHEQGWNAMVRARFNGSNVPVEMMSLSVE